MKPCLAAISVANIDTAVAWYRNVLELRVVERKAFEEQGIKLAFLECRDFRLELVELQNSVSPTSCTDVSNPATLRGFGKLAFRVDDLRQVMRQLARHEVGILHDFSSAPDAKLRSVIVKDVDGNWLQFFQNPRK